jgi:hypothetical protein
MIRALLLPLLALGAVASSIPAVVALSRDGVNLLENGDAEAGSGRAPKSWSNTGGSNARFEWKEVEGGGAKGAGKNHVLTISNDAEADRDPHNWRQSIDLPAKRPARLELRARAKSPRMDEAASACVMAQCWNAEGKASAYAWSDKIEGAGEWRDVSAVFDVPADCKSIQVLAYLVGAGEVWFDDLSLAETGKPPRSSDGRSPDADVKLQALARGAAPGIPWLFDAGAAKKAAAAGDRPILLYVRCIDDDAQLAAAQQELAAASVGFIDDGLRKDVLMRAGPLSDADVVELVKRRFVPLLLTYDLSKHGMGASNDDPLAALGLKSSEIVTPALLVLDERGKLVHKLHRLGTLNAPLVDSVLRAALDKSGAKAKAAGAATAEESAAAGELDAAIRLLQGKSEPAAKALLARCLRRKGDLAGAEKALAGVNGGEAELERGRVALARGEWEKALAALEKATSEEGRYWAAFCLDRLGRGEEATKELRELVGESLFGRKAAAALLTEGPRLLLAESPRAIAGLPELPESTEGLPGTFDPDASLRALMELQRTDGSFVGHLGLWDASLTAFALDALDAGAATWGAKLPAATKARAKDSGKRALAWLVEWCKREPNPATDPFHQPYVLLTLARLGEKKAVERLVARILQLQQQDGNWTVYGADRPASFNTALAVEALLAAKAAGVGVDAAKLDAGVKALEGMRKKDDLFCYSTKVGHEWMTTPHGSIARDCLCEVALLRAGRKELPKIAAALDRFVEHAHELREPTKRLYDYFDSRGHGGYFFFFAHWHALDAARELPAVRRKKAVDAIRKEILACREIDGTWVDHAMLGRAYGTAQALKILALAEGG